MAIRGRPATAPGTRRLSERFRLVGPTLALDPRVNAVRRDIADIGLADRVFAPHYAAPETCGCTAISAMLYDAPSEDATAVSQIVLGERFAVVDVAAGWAWGYSLHDNYVGYVSTGALGPTIATTHIVAAPAAPLFARPDIKSAVHATYPIGARLLGSDAGAFVAIEGGFVHRRHLVAAGEPESDPVAVAERLVGAPYLWGGRGAGGIDCSGLVQRALGLCNVSAPRDSDQQRALGRELAAGEPAARGDIVLFPGHVGLMADDSRLVHANAHWMAVTIEPLDAVVARGAEIVSRRRISA